MTVWAKRLDGRMRQKGVAKLATARLVGCDRQTLDRLRTGTIEQNLPTDQFLRLCAHLDMTPDQFFGLAPMDGADPPLPPPVTGPMQERVQGALTALPAHDRRLAADLLEALARFHNSLVEDEEPRPPPRPRRRKPVSDKPPPP